jgi:hypothetical protein
LLRYLNLVERGIVNNRTSLRNLIEEGGFSEGFLLGPNSRAWWEDEVEEWLANRPTARKPAPVLKPGSRPGRPSKAELAARAAAAQLATPPPASTPAPLVKRRPGRPSKAESAARAAAASSQV